MRLDAATVHASLGTEGWRRVLATLGVAEEFLKNSHGPCPACGGKDRFRFDNKGRGAFYCNNCGAGDGFGLLIRIHGWSFSEVIARVAATGGIASTERIEALPAAKPDPEIARPTRRIVQLLRESCGIEDCDAAIRYLESRALWPLPPHHMLRAHPSTEYWHERKRVGRFPALVSAVRDVNGQLVTAHVTYLTADGQKLATHEPRKLLSPVVGREGCAVRLTRGLPEVLGVAEGVETALSAAKLESIHCWAALNSSLLAKFSPPPGVSQLVIFADRDVAGLEAATKLMQRLQGKLPLEVRTPQAKDWNDVLRSAA